MIETLEGLKSVAPKASPPTHALVTKCVHALRQIRKRDDRAALCKVVLASVTLFVSYVATMLAIILEFEGFAPSAWLTLALVAIVCSFTTTLLMVRYMMSKRKTHTDQMVGSSTRNPQFVPRRHTRPSRLFPK
jgi:general stress protein CsbA